MRRDYFTCVFLACIAGALCFVCFEPLYFKYSGIAIREFSMFEVVMSVLYTVFFLIVIPFYSGLKRKYWIAVGLACYGVLAFIPKLFYPSEALLSGSGASIIHVIWALILRGIYGMVNAPFAALSSIAGDGFASAMSYLILPMSVLIPFMIKAYRFYRDAYVAEQLSPAPAAPAEKKAPREKHKPEVLGTIISAPVRRKENAAAAPEQLKAPDGEAAGKIEPPVNETAGVIESGKGEDAIPLPEGTKRDRPKIRAPKILSGQIEPPEEGGTIRLPPPKVP
ncbi:hypothetical protein SAMN02910456_01828 [Ruminococcaceae bacterium YRB3002]|nr:hypothetical protein SAMN02910456_01828 [Ruminococcaceae bacterium YRB3002]